MFDADDDDWGDAPTAFAGDVTPTPGAGGSLPSQMLPPPPPPPRRVGSSAGTVLPTAVPSHPDLVASAPELTHSTPAPANHTTDLDASTSVDSDTGEILDPAPAKPKTKSKGKSRVAKEASGAITMPGGLRLTDRDHQMLNFLARYRLATIGQLARHFDTSETALRNRLPRLEKAGLLAWAYTGQTKPKVWTITDTGLKVCGAQLSAPQISWGTLRHTLGLVDLGTTFETAGELVVTEREVRAAATRNVPTARMKTAIDIRKSLNADPGADSASSAQAGYIVPMAGRQWGHIPDMVLVRQPFENGSPGSIAIELELTRKNLSEWRNILTAYRDNGQFAQVVYYVTDADIEKAVTATINALGAQDRIQVVRFTPIETTALPNT